MQNMKKIFPYITYTENAKEAIKGSDACLILTEWSEFKNLSNNDFGLMNTKIIIEARKIIDPNKVDEYEGICG